MKPFFYKSNPKIICFLNLNINQKSKKNKNLTLKPDINSQFINLTIRALLAPRSGVTIFIKWPKGTPLASCLSGVTIFTIVRSLQELKESA